jgi:hypothetical protein
MRSLITTTIAAMLAIVALLWHVRASAQEWTDGDWVRQGSWEVLHILDWAQTRDVARNPQRFIENNPAMGEHPSVKRVDSYMGAWLLIHPAISHALPRLGALLPENLQRALGVRHWREGWQYVTLGVKAGAVYNNFTLGVRADFN